MRNFKNERAVYPPGIADHDLDPSRAGLAQRLYFSVSSGVRDCSWHRRTFFLPVGRPAGDVFSTSAVILFVFLKPLQ